MATDKTRMIPYTKPEEILLARILTQAIEDIDHLPNVDNEHEFQSLRNDLWSFFGSTWFYEILEILDISSNKVVWNELRNRIWNCTTHKPPYVRPSRRKDKEDDTISISD